MQNVRRDLCPGFGQSVTTVAFRPVRVGFVLEIVERRSRSGAGAVLQRYGAVCVTDSALAELFARLMGVATIALGVLREARLQARGRAVACITGQLLGTGRPL